MPKFAVYAQATVSKYLGEFEGEDESAAIDAAVEKGEYTVSLCYQCSRNVGDMGDTEFVAEPATA